MSTFRRMRVDSIASIGQEFELWGVVADNSVKWRVVAVEDDPAAVWSARWPLPDEDEEPSMQPSSYILVLRPVEESP